MPLSDHEQRMLDQIESALYAEDPKFASSVRGGGGLRAPSARRRLQGAVLFLVGLAMLVAGVAVTATMVAGFPVLSVVGFLVMFGGVVLAMTRPKAGAAQDKDKDKDKSGGSPAPGAGKPRKVRDGGSFTSRMEDRFRKRFDE